MFIADITDTYPYSYFMLNIPDNDTSFVYVFWHDLACGSIMIQINERTSRMI